MQAHVRRHLQECARGCHHLVLWLDCDREGENICFEVLECAAPALAPARPRRHAWRARFSAITAPEIHAAMASLGEPNEAEALAVDARQELDLKVRTLRAACWACCAQVACKTRGAFPVRGPSEHVIPYSIARLYPAAPC